MQYAYRDRRDRKGDFRQLWITRINAAARANGMTYNRLIQGLRLAGVEVDRKILAELAVNDAAAFAGLVEVAKPPSRPTAPAAARPPPEHGSASPTRGGPVHRADAPGRRCPAPAAPPRPRRDRPVPGRGPAGGPRGAGRRRGHSSCSAPPTRRPAHADAAEPAPPVSPVTDDGAGRAHRDRARRRAWWRSAAARTSPPAPTRWRKRPAAGRGAGRHPRPGQRRHRPAHRRRGRRGRGGLRGRRVDPYNGKGVRASGRQPVPRRRGPGARSAATVAALRAAGLHGPGRRRLRRRSISTTWPTAGLAAPTAWLFGSEAHGLPAELLAARRRPGPGAASTAARRA